MQIQAKADNILFCAVTKTMKMLLVTIEFVCLEFIKNTEFAINGCNHIYRCGFGPSYNSIALTYQYLINVCTAVPNGRGHHLNTLTHESVLHVGYGSAD